MISIFLFISKEIRIKKIMIILVKIILDFGKLIQGINKSQEPLLGKVKILLVVMIDIYQILVLTLILVEVD